MDDLIKTEDTFTIEGFEAHAYQLAAAVSAGSKFGAAERMLADVLKIAWAWSMPLDRWVRIAEAANPYVNIDLNAWQRAMTHLVRAGVMRGSRMQGEYKYEANFTELLKD